MTSLALIAPLPALAMNSQDVAATVTNFLQERTHDLPGAVSISVTPPSEKQQLLQSCMQAQTFLPQGQKAWGRVTVGVRCTDGSNASLYISARVKVDGSYVKLARAISGGQTLGDGDVQIEQGELTAHPDDLVLTLRDAVGKTTKQALSPGQALRGAFLQYDIGIQAGQSVQVIANGGGFSVANRGRALNNAARGALTRVKLDNGQIVSGIAIDAATVEVGGR
jgi:flagella basal body P-ring formation protein FlgA